MFNLCKLTSRVLFVCKIRAEKRNGKKEFAYTCTMCVLLNCIIGTLKIADPNEYSACSNKLLTIIIIPQERHLYPYSYLIEYRITE